MFKIEELLYFFEYDLDVVKIISSAYTISQRENKELSDKVFEKLLFLKSIQPNLCIKVDYKSNASSNYNPNTNTIHLNGIFDETTFLHELTHLFSYNYSKFDIPQEYNNFKNEFFSSSQNDSLVISLLNLCKMEKQKLLKPILSVETSENINKNLSNMPVDDKYTYFIISKIEDIIDSIYCGSSHTHGLTYLKDNNYYTEKAFKSSGHGCDYFLKTGYEFEEIIANYQAIKLIDPNNKFFTLLKQILGIDFVSFLDDRCQLINGEQAIGLNLNNNIKK